MFPFLTAFGEIHGYILFRRKSDINCFSSPFFCLVQIKIMSLVGRFLFFIQSITVEPIGFLSFLSLNSNRFAMGILVLEACCEQNHGDNPLVNCSPQNYTLDPEVQDDVQAEAINWNTKFMLAAILPGIPAQLFWG